MPSLRTSPVRIRPVRITVVRIAAAISAVAALAVGCTSDITGDPGPDPRTQINGPSIPDKEYLKAEDYEYTLELICQCELSGVPVRVQVEHGKAMQATFLEPTRQHEAGEVTRDADFLVTINDIIDAVNDDTVFEVNIDWPATQDWPNRVNVDPLENTNDEEYGYRIADVEIED